MKNRGIYWLSRSSHEGGGMFVPKGANRLSYELRTGAREIGTLSGRRCFFCPDESCENRVSHALDVIS
jgi:hypothetical protein